jgi:hypothetical protein
VRRRGAQVAGAVFALRGTRLSKAGTVQADVQLMVDRDAELYYAQRALKHVRRHIRRLQQQQPDTQWAFFTTGAGRPPACPGLTSSPSSLPREHVFCMHAPCHRIVNACSFAAKKSIPCSFAARRLQR